MDKRKTVKERNKELAISGKQLKKYGIVLHICPTDAQKLLIKQTFGCVRYIYNKYLADRQEHYKDTGKTLSMYDYKSNYLNPMKRLDEYSFLKIVDKFALEAAIENVDDAYDRFFKGQNGFPKFKSKHKAKQAYTTKYTNKNIEIIDETIKLPKLKLIKFSMPNKKYISKNLQNIICKEAQIKSVTISEKAGKYYASLSCEEVIDIVRPIDLKNVASDKVVGIDLGLIDFATINNGITDEKIPCPKYLRKAENKLAKEQRELSKKKEGSKNFIKAKMKVAKTHEKIANQRKDFHHQLSRRLVNENQVVIVEDLNIKGMVKNKNLAKSISDAGWSRFIIYLDYKLKSEGKYLVKVDRWFASSKLCSGCYEKNIMLTLNDRVWVCNSCNTEHDRDVNASLNIRYEGLKVLKLIA